MDEEEVGWYARCFAEAVGCYLVRGSLEVESNLENWLGRFFEDYYEEVE
jgi:hypothetical protein